MRMLMEYHGNRSLGLGRTITFVCRHSDGVKTLMFDQMYMT